MFHKSLSITVFCLVKALKYQNASNIIELTVFYIRHQHAAQKSQVCGVLSNVTNASQCTIKVIEYTVFDK
jgi:hypothetical protein